MSARYTIATFKFPNTLVIKTWKVPDAAAIPNDILVKQYCPPWATIHLNMMLHRRDTADVLDIVLEPK